MPSATGLPTCAPSSARSKLTALISAPAPKASTSPTIRCGRGRASPSSAPMISDDAASAPQPRAAPIASDYSEVRRDNAPMAKIAFIGAGSTVFARALIGDVLLHPELRDTTFALMDIDADRLVNVQGLVVEAALTGRRE